MITSHQPAKQLDCSLDCNESLGPYMYAEDMTSPKAIQQEVLMYADNVVCKRIEGIIEPNKTIGAPTKDTKEVLIEDEQLRKYPTLKFALCHLYHYFSETL